MKQFNLEEYLKNPERKIVTRDGRSARIICTDVKKKPYYGVCYNILYLVESKGEEDVFLVSKDGSSSSGSNYDLFFAPEKHEGWVVMREHTIIAGPFIDKDVTDLIIKDDDCKSVKITWEE